MPTLFTVLPNGKRIPYGAKAQAFLLTDNWDDWFTFNTLYSLVIFDADGNEHRIGGVKIGQAGMVEGQRRPNIPELFNALSDEFFSLGQDDSYYEKLNELGPEIRDEILRGLCDTALDQERFLRALNEKVTGVSLLRSVTRSTVQGQFARLARGGARLSKYLISNDPQHSPERPAEPEACTARHR